MGHSERGSGGVPSCDTPARCVPIGRAPTVAPCGAVRGAGWNAVLCGVGGVAKAGGGQGGSDVVYGPAGVHCATAKPLNRHHKADRR